jgi:hypothetical protein
MTGLKDFVLVHKTDYYEELKEDAFVMKGRVTITHNNWKLPGYLNYWKVQGNNPSKKKQLYFSLLSKDIKYDEDFASDSYLLYLDPKLLKDYSDKVHITPFWTFGVELSNTMYYDSSKTLLQNLKRFNKGIIEGHDSIETAFMNEVVIEADEIDIKKYLLDTNKF